MQGFFPAYNKNLLIKQKQIKYIMYNTQYLFQLFTLKIYDNCTV